MNTETQTNTEIVKTAGQIALPFDHDQFKDFIVSLLGKPQTITKSFRGNFEIDKDTIVSIFELLNQRIFQQNDSKLIQFCATIYYDDNSTVTLNGFDHLVNYNERLPLVSIAAHLTFQFLVKFRDKETYEKQEISISFLTNNGGYPLPEIDGIDYYRHLENMIAIRIAHTARTWGADIEGLLSRHIKTIVKKDSKFLNFFKYNFEKVEHLYSAIIFLITLVFTIIRTINLPDNISSKDLLFHYGNTAFLFVGIYILVKLTLVLLEEFEINGKPSFILLTPESTTNKDKKLKSYRKDWLKYLSTIIISLVLGIVSNIIYNNFIAH